MASDMVYNATTMAEPEQRSKRYFSVPNSNLDFIRFIIKVVEVVLSFVAFVVEESVTTCTSCSELYFFEFVSCTAFLFTLLLLVLLATPMHLRVGIKCWPKLDFVYSLLIAVFLIIASIAFAANNTGSVVERSTVAFGFLASFAFFADVLVLFRRNGFPFSRANRDAAEGSSAPAQEVEKLNSNGTNGANSPEP